MIMIIVSRIELIFIVVETDMDQRLESDYSKMTALHVRMYFRGLHFWATFDF